MTYQEFNHLYVKFVNSKRGVGPHERVSMTGLELKRFLEYYREEIDKEEERH
jgi:hypothetical protein